MTTCSSCGRDAIPSLAEHPLCPTCLLLLGLEAGHEHTTDRDIAARFRLIAPIGRGPDGTVYLAQPVRDPHRFVTLKLFEPPLDVGCFIRHVGELAARISACERTASLTIPQAGATSTSRAYVAARYVTGTPAATYFQVSARKTTDRLRMVAQLCRLVSDIHDSEIVHGAIKASNIIVAAGPQGATPILLDTGLRPALDTARLCSPGQLSARLAARRAIDRRGDIHALRRFVLNMLATARTCDELATASLTLERREYATAAELADHLDDIANRTTS